MFRVRLIAAWQIAEPHTLSERERLPLLQVQLDAHAIEFVPNRPRHQLEIRLVFGASHESPVAFLAACYFVPYLSLLCAELLDDVLPAAARAGKMAADAVVRSRPRQVDVEYVVAVDLVGQQAAALRIQAMQHVDVRRVGRRFRG